MKYIDLHVHTTKSDGTAAPEEIAPLAKKAGLSAVAVTDHDTVDGIAAAAAAGEKCGVEIIPGIEFGTGWEHTEIHILGYLCDPGSPELRPALDWVINDRRERNEKMAALMRGDGIDVTAEEMYRKYPDSTVGRPHFAVKLMEAGLARSVTEAFKKYLAPGEKYYVRRNFIPFAEAVRVIRAAGGKAVLAHPFQYKYDDERLHRLLDYCADVGIEGMECLYTGYTPEQSGYLTRLAGEYGLFPTGGSDFHGGHKPDIAIGTGHGDLRVPYWILENMRK